LAHEIQARRVRLCQSVAAFQQIVLGDIAGDDCAEDVEAELAQLPPVPLPLAAEVVKYRKQTLRKLEYADEIDRFLNSAAFGRRREERGVCSREEKGEEFEECEREGVAVEIFGLLTVLRLDRFQDFKVLVAREDRDTEGEKEGEGVRERESEGG
jgi:hypothetical protein